MAKLRGGLVPFASRIKANRIVSPYVERNFYRVWNVAARLTSFKFMEQNMRGFCERLHAADCKFYGDLSTADLPQGFWNLENTRSDSAAIASSFFIEIL